MDAVAPALLPKHLMQSQLFQQMKYRVSLTVSFLCRYNSQMLHKLPITMMPNEYTYEANSFSPKNLNCNQKNN